jgi:hypothetical protein
MRAVVVTFFAAAGLFGLLAPAQAALVVTPSFLAGNPALTQVVQRCGKGYYRQNAWQDKQGAWHGKCVPKPVKKAPKS